MDPAAAEERFNRLEIKAAYLEKLALELNDVIVEQAKQLTDVSERLQRMERQLQAAAEDRELPQEKPPHY